PPPVPPLHQPARRLRDRSPLVPQPRPRRRVSAPLHRRVLGLRRLLPDLLRPRAAEPVLRAAPAGAARRRRRRPPPPRRRARAHASPHAASPHPRAVLRPRWRRPVGRFAALAQRRPVRRGRSRIRPRQRLLISLAVVLSLRAML